MNPNFIGKETAAQRDKITHPRSLRSVDSGFEGNAFSLPTLTLESKLELDYSIIVPPLDTNPYNH